MATLLPTETTLARKDLENIIDEVYGEKQPSQPASAPDKPAEDYSALWSIPKYETPPPKPKEAPGLGDYAKEFVGALTRLPRQTASIIADTISGPDDVWLGEEDLANKIAENDVEKTREHVRKLEDKFGKENVAGPFRALAEANFGYTTAAAGAGFAGGAAGGIAGGALAGPPGALAGRLIGGTAVPTYLLQRASAASIMREMLKYKNEESMAIRGHGLSRDEQKQLKGWFKDKADEVGLWESGSESIGNIAQFELLLGKLSKIVGGSPASRIGIGLASIFLPEWTEEIVSQVGSERALAGTPLGPDEAPPVGPESIGRAAQETFWPTAVQTIPTAGLLGGAKIGMRYADRRLKDRRSELARLELEKIIDEVDQAAGRAETIRGERLEAEMADIATATEPPPAAPEPAPTPPSPEEIEAARQRYDLKPGAIPAYQYERTRQAVVPTDTEVQPEAPVEQPALPEAEAPRALPYPEYAGEGFETRPAPTETRLKKGPRQEVYPEEGYRAVGLTDRESLGIPAEAAPEAPGQPVVEYKDIASKSGAPFKNKGAATLAKRTRKDVPGIEKYNPAQVEGGWVLRRLGEHIRLEPETAPRRGPRAREADAMLDRQAERLAGEMGLGYKGPVKDKNENVIGYSFTDPQTGLDFTTEVPSKKAIGESLFSTLDRAKEIQKQQQPQEQKPVQRQNVIGVVVDMGKIRPSKDYNYSELKQFADLDRMFSKNGTRDLDDVVAELKAAGYPIDNADDFIEKGKTGQLRNMFPVERQDEFTDKKIAQIEKKEATSALRSDIINYLEQHPEQADELRSLGDEDVTRIVDEIFPEGSFDPGTKAAALRAIQKESAAGEADDSVSQEEIESLLAGWDELTSGEVKEEQLEFFRPTQPTLGFSVELPKKAAMQRKERDDLPQKEQERVEALRKDIRKAIAKRKAGGVSEAKRRMAAKRYATEGQAGAGGVKTLGVGISADLVDHGGVDLLDYKITSADDLAEVAQAYRDPRVETFRIIFLKDNRVVYHEGVSSRMPGFSYFGKSLLSASKNVARINRLKTKFKADSYYLLHNHPSGNPKPSVPEDVGLTDMIAKKVPGFKAHVIIDSGTYGELVQAPETIGGKRSWQYAIKKLPNLPRGWKDPLLTPALDHPALGSRISTTVDVGFVGASITDKTKNYTTLLYRDSGGRVRAIQEMPANLFENTEMATQYIRGRLRDFGAPHVAVYFDKKPTMEQFVTGVSLIQNGVALDGVWEEEGKYFGLSDLASKKKGMRMGKPREAYKPVFVAERQAPYRPTIEKLDELAPETQSSVIEENFGRKKQTVKEKIDDAADSIRTREGRTRLQTLLFDRMLPIKEHLGERAYKFMRRTTGTQISTAMFLEHGKFIKDKDAGGFVINDTGKGVLPFLSSLGKDWKNLFYWEAAKRAQYLDEVEGLGRENWLTKEKRDAIFKEAGGEDNPKLVKAHKELQGFNKNILDLAEWSGLINKEDRAMWEQEFYVPFYRLLEDEQARHEILQGPWKSSRFISARIRQLTGKKAKLGDPFENVLKNWMHLINESMRNIAMNEAYSSAMAKGLAQEVKKIPKQDMYFVRDITRKGKKRFLSKQEQNQMIMFKRDGNSVYFITEHPDLFKALADIRPYFSDNLFMRMMTRTKRWLTQGATFGPAFRVANALRDTIMTSMLDKSFRPFIDSAKGFVKAMREDKDFVKFASTGFAFGSSYVKTNDAKSSAAFINKILKKAEKNSVLLSSPAKALAWWDKVGSASENAARMMVFQRNIEKGDTVFEAGFKARDLLDFTMSGASPAVQLLIHTIPFLNARMQGLYKLGRTGASSDAEIRNNFYKRGLMYMGASIALWAIFKDDERYKDLQDYDKWLYHHFWIGDTHVRLPMPFEVGSIFGAFPLAILDAINKTDDGKHVTDFIGFTMRQTFALDIPQLFRPLAEQYFNKSTFTGRPIVSERLKGRIPSEQADPWTSETMRAFGKAVNISPKRMEALIEGYFSTMGTFALWWTDLITRNALDFPERPAWQLQDYPVLGRFFRGDPERYTKYDKDFYEIAKDMEQIARTLTEYRQTGRYRDALDLTRKEANKVSMNKAFVMARRQLSDISRQIRRIWDDKNMSPGDKKKRIDVLTEQKQAIQKRMVSLYRKAEKQ